MAEVCTFISSSGVTLYIIVMSTVSIVMQPSITCDTDGIAWRPRDVLTIDGRCFVALRHTDRQLAAFCGLKREHGAMQHHLWIDTLRAMRNAAVAHVITHAVAERAPDGRVGNVHQQAKTVEDSDLPQIIEVEIPAATYGEAHIGATTVAVAFERNPKKVVYVEATPENCMFIRAAVRASRVDEPVRERRAASERVQTMCKDVYMNYQRNCLVYRFKDEDGQMKSRSRRVSSQSDVSTVAMQLANADI